MDLSSRLGQVWALNDGETIELIVNGVWIAGRINEVRWTTLVLWSQDRNPNDPYVGSHQPGCHDQVGETAFVNAERRDDPSYFDWKRIL